MYYIYMVRCVDNSVYTGITTDIKRRFSEHQGSPKGAKYTKSHNVVSIEAVWEAPDKVSASKLEYRIKKLQKPDKEKLIERKIKIGNLWEDIEENLYKRLRKNTINAILKKENV